MRAVRASALISIGISVLPGAVVSAAAPQSAVPQSSAASLAPSVFADFAFSGGDRNDREFARAASGLVSGRQVSGPKFNEALEAIRATDRFSLVEGELESRPAGQVARIHLEPWPVVKTWDWRGDPIEKKTQKMLFPDLRDDIHLGDLRLADWRHQAEAKLRDEGYPLATIAMERAEGGTRIIIVLKLGHADLIRTVDVHGDLNSYTLHQILKAAEIDLGKTLWTTKLRREAARKVRGRFAKDKRLEGRAEFAYASDGTLSLDVDSGPRVTIHSDGENLSQRTLRELLPLARTDRYSPELLDEGDRRIVHYFRDKGFLDVVATHSREVVAGTSEKPGEVRVTYHIQLSDRRFVKRLKFEGNQEITDAELQKAADLPSGFMWVYPSRATPDLLADLETRVKNIYLSKGFSEVRLRRHIENREGQQTLIFNIKEGPQRTVRSIILEMPDGPLWDPWKLGESLLKAFSDKPILLQPVLSQRRRYQSDRHERKGLTAVLELLPSEIGKPKRAVRLLTEQPVPYLRADLGEVLSSLNQQVAALGSTRPVVRTPRFDEDESGVTVRIEIPPQPLQQVRRLVVQGSDETQSVAVLREARDLIPGNPLNLDKVGRAQANLGNLGAFKRVDIESLRESLAPPGVPPDPNSPWQDGDLSMNLQERSHWVFTESFGYDKSYGYSLGYGVQRLNFQGMGRTLDFGLRAGDGTLHNPTLARIFPTGDFARSVDSYSMGYTDPWFAPGVLTNWLPERALYHADAAYIQEQQTAYLIRRRRIQNSLEWRLDEHRILRVGHRFERVDVRANRLSPRPGDPILAPDYLNKATKSPARSTISAPFVEWIRDTRDSPYDPTSGSVTAARVEFANQIFGTSSNSSFVKVDVRQQWTWPIGYRASAGVVSLGLRVGAARPTASSSRELPLSERFFAGGSSSQRGVEPDYLGPLTSVPVFVRHTDGTYSQLFDPSGQFAQYEQIPIGGQAIALINLDYRFPIYGESIWGEVFVDSGQVYATLVTDNSTTSLPTVGRFPHLRTSAGIGLIFKLGLPIKIEYGTDLNRILGRPRTELEQTTQLHSLLISAGFQF